MQLDPSAEQEALRQASADWLEANMPLANARNRAPGQWRAMAEMGWFGLAAEEAHGGLALDHAAEALIFTELGRVLAPVAAVANAVVGKWGPGAIAPDFVSGAEKAALGLAAGGDVRVLDGAEAAHVLVIAGDAVSLHAAPELDLAQRLDPTHRQAKVAAEALGAQLFSANGRGPFAHLQLLAASYALGAAEAARDMAAAYASMREQFGRPIGAFQGIKHPCADMAVRCYAARAQLLYAACAFDAGTPDADFHIAAAKRLCDQAALENASANIQVHGGVGMTDEAQPHLVLKRAHLLSFIAAPGAAQLLA